MKLIVLGLKRTSAFIYILAALLLFYLVFNLSYQWFGISLIVRIYIYLFCFYLVFNFSSINIDLYEEFYRTRFGRQGEQILFYKARVVPFLIILGVIAVFGLIDGIGQPNWPWEPVLSVLNGRFSNLMVYSLFLLFVLKIHKGPVFTVPLFLGLCLAYFYLDTALETVLVSGSAAGIAAYLKLLIFFFFLFLEFYVRRNPLKLFATAVAVSLVAFTLLVGANGLVLKWSPARSFQKRESGMRLLRLGFRFPLGAMKREVQSYPDPELLKAVIGYAREYKSGLTFTREEWERLLFSGQVDMADQVSEYMIKKGVDVPYEKIVEYALEKSAAPDSRLESAHHFTRLAALSLRGNEKDFQNRMRGSGKRFTLWAIAVTAEQKNPVFIPLLLEYLTDVDPGLEEAAYIALSRITGEDPKEKLNRRINDTAVVVYFKEYFLRNRKAY